MLRFSIPPRYRCDKEIRRPKLDGYTGIIDQIPEADKLVPKKQRHTSKRIFERLRDEHHFAGGLTIVKNYIFAAKQRQREIQFTIFSAQICLPSIRAVAIVNAPTESDDRDSCRSQGGWRGEESKRT